MDYKRGLELLDDLEDELPQVYFKPSRKPLSVKRLQNYFLVFCNDGAVFEYRPYPGFKPKEIEPIPGSSRDYVLRQREQEGQDDK